MSEMQKEIYAEKEAGDELEFSHHVSYTRTNTVADKDKAIQDLLDALDASRNDIRSLKANIKTLESSNRIKGVEAQGLCILLDIQRKTIKENEAAIRSLAASLALCEYALGRTISFKPHTKPQRDIEQTAYNAARDALEAYEKTIKEASK